jgi:hypothetical protein
MRGKSFAFVNSKIAYAFRNLMCSEDGIIKEKVASKNEATCKTP